MMAVPDAGSLAAMRVASERLGRRVGGSTGTNLWGAFALIAGMLAAGETGSVVTLLCDGGERYANTYYDDTWLAAHGLDSSDDHEGDARGDQAVFDRRRTGFIGREALQKILHG